MNPRMSMTISEIERERASFRAEVEEYAAENGLVLIDPDDREQVERLATIVDEWWSHAPYSDMRKDGDLTTTTAMQAALREFANPTPPKPDEPTGLGAVVEDSTGVQWIRCARRMDYAWQIAGADGSPWVRYDEIAAVTVLNGGAS